MAESFSVKAILSATDKGFSSAMKSASQSITNLKSTVTSGLGFGIMAGIGQSAFNALKNTVTGFTGSIINTGATFQAEMSRVQAISGATASEFEKLRKQAIQLGADTAFSSTEVAQGMENLAAAGFTTNEIMSAMPGLLNMAAASGENLASSSDIAASTLRGFGLAAEDMSHVADVLAENANRTNSSVSQTGEAMKYIAPLARAAGISFEETAAAIGIMANAGIQGSQAGTTLRGALSRLSKPTDTMITAMKQLGVSFYDSSGKMKPLSEQIGMLKNAMSGMTDEQRNNYLVTLYGQEALSGMLALINEGEGSLNSLTEAYRKCDGSAEKAAETMLNNFNGAVEEMNGSVESLGISIFYSLSEPLTAAVKSITEFVNLLNAEFKIGDAEEKIKKFVDNASKYLDILKENGADVAKAFGDAFSAIGDSLSELNGAFGSTESIKSFSDVITAAKDALVGFAGFLEDNADAIAKLITNLPKLWLAFQGFKVLKTATPLVSAFAGGIKKLGSAALSKIAPNLFGIAKGQDEVGKSSKRTSKQTLNSAKAFMMMGAGVLLVSSSMFVLAQAAIQLADSGGTAIGVFAGMTAAVTALSLGMAYMLANIKSTPKQIETMGNSFLKMSVGVSLVVASLSALALALVPLGELGSTAVPALAAFGVVVGGLAAVFGTFGQKLQSSMTGIIAFSGSVSVLALAMTPLASTGTEGAIAMAAFGVVVAGLVAIFATFGTALNAAIPAMLAFGATILMVGEGMNLASSFIDALVPLIQQLGDTFQTVGETIGNVAESIGEAIKTVGEGIATVVDSITGGLSNILQSIADIISSIGQSAKDAGTGFKSVAEGIGMIAALSLIDIVKSLGAVATGISTISKKGKDLPEVAAGMQQLMSALVMASAAITVFVAGMQQISTISTVASTSLSAVQAAFNGFVIVPPDVSPMTTAFASITAAALAMVPKLNNAGQQAGQGLAKGLESGSRSAEKATTTAVRSITNETQKLVPQMTNSGKQAANGFSVALQSGYARALSLSRNAVSSILSALRGAQSGAYSAGYNIGAGLANGMAASLGRVQSIATQLAAAAERAIRAEAQIHSPSRVTDKLGQYFGEGWVEGIKSMARDAKQATAELIAIPSLPDVPTPSLSGAGGGSWELSEDYSYTRNAKYTIVIPVNLEGKEVSRITAPFMEEDLRKREKVNNMINGIR